MDECTPLKNSWPSWTSSPPRHGKAPQPRNISGEGRPLRPTAPTPAKKSRQPFIVRPPRSMVSLLWLATPYPTGALCHQERCPPTDDLSLQESPSPGLLPRSLFQDATTSSAPPPHGPHQDVGDDGSPTRTSVNFCSNLSALFLLWSKLVCMTQVSCQWKKDEFFNPLATEQINQITLVFLNQICFTHWHPWIKSSNYTILLVWWLSDLMWMKTN
jgi:hypothetical protein